MDAAGATPARLPDVGRVTVSDILAALRAGWYDFRAAPAFGLFFSAAHVVAGVVLVWLGAGTMTWVLTVTLGFPLVAPFAAVGLYEVSRRREAGVPLRWRAILGVVAAERGRQTVWLGAIMLIGFVFWSFAAHLVFALVMGVSGVSDLRTAGSGTAALLTLPGATLVAAEILVGGCFAFLIFGAMVMALPLCLDLDVDFISAIMLSLRTVAANRAAMVLWAAIVAGTTILALLPVFLGLLVALPVIGHASWHLYRRALYLPA